MADPEPMLEIPDGPQWWRSPNIRVIPEFALPGAAFVGVSHHVEAYIRNIAGADPSPAGERTHARSAVIHFYWADPSTKILLGTAHKIGNAPVPLLLPNGGNAWVRCPDTWTPDLAYGPHQCLIALADDNSSSFYKENKIAPPGPLPKSFDFEPYRYREIAQRNLSLLLPKTRAPLIKVWAEVPKDKLCAIEAVTGGELDRQQLMEFGLDGYRPSKRPGLKVVLCPVGQASGRHAQPSASDRGLQLSIPAGGTVGVTVNVEAHELTPREYALIDVIERVGERIVGGCAFVVVPELPDSAGVSDCATISL